MQASQRLDRFGAEVFASLNNKLLALKAQGKTIYNMSVGTPDFKPYDHVVEALTQAAQDPEMWKYALRDLPELKQAVCDYYERRFGVSGITPSMVQSCNGTQEGVGHLGLALLDPGDTILVPDPCYPVFEAGAKIADAKLEYYPLIAEHNYLPYVAGIDPEVADRAKYMIVSLPANPVGSVGTPEVYEEIIAFAREHDLLIVHDNAYSDIVFDGEPGGSFLQYPGALEVGVEFFSLSKSFNVTGARIGFLVGREDVVSAFAKLRGQIEVPASASREEVEAAARANENVQRFTEGVTIRTGVVVDYLNCLFINFPVFNFADVCICVGVGLLVLSLLLDMRREQKAKQQKGSAPTDGTA